MAKALVAARMGFRRLFSISAFTPPPAAPLPPKAEPSTNLFISGLSKRTTSEGLREAFSKFGEVIHARVVTDRVSGYSKGFGFVRYASLEEAAEGINGMDGKFLDGWVIFAEYARPRPPLSQDQSSQPQMNYGSSPMSQSTSFYPSAATPNYSSPASSPPPPPSSSNYSPQTTPPSFNNSYYAPPTSQPQQSYGGSAPPSNYESSPPQSNHSSSPPSFNNSYYAPPTSQPQQSYGGSAPPSNYESSLPQSNYSSSYFNQSSSPPPPPPQINGSAPPTNYESVHSQSSYSSYYNHSNGSPPPFNYSSEISQPTSNSSAPTPPWYSPQTTQHYTHSQYGSAPATNHSSQAPQQGFSYTPPAADLASGYASAAQNDSVKAESPPSFASASNADTFETASSYSSERPSEYEPGRAANY